MVRIKDEKLEETVEKSAVRSAKKQAIAQSVHESKAEKRTIEDEINDAINVAQKLIAAAQDFDQSKINSHSDAGDADDDNFEGRRSIGYDKFSSASNPNPIYMRGAVLDYDELFSHLGNLQTRNAYERSQAFASEIQSKELVEHSVITESDTSAVIKSEKYFTPGPKMTGSWGLIPPEGVSSQKWEAWKIYSVLHPEMVKVHWNMN